MKKILQILAFAVILLSIIIITRGVVMGRRDYFRDFMKLKELLPVVLIGTGAILLIVSNYIKAGKDDFKSF